MSCAVNSWACTLPQAFSLNSNMAFLHCTCSEQPVKLAVQFGTVCQQPDYGLKPDAALCQASHSINTPRKSPGRSTSISYASPTSSG